jgi:hypothetical protein
MCGGVPDGCIPDVAWDIDDLRASTTPNAGGHTGPILASPLAAMDHPVVRV